MDVIEQARLQANVEEQRRILFEALRSSPTSVSLFAATRAISRSNSSCLRRSSALLCELLASLRRRFTYLAAGVAGVSGAEQPDDDDDINDNSVAMQKESGEKVHLERAASVCASAVALCAAAAG